MQRPAHHPASVKDLHLRLFEPGSVEPALERETQRNVELIWLTDRLGLPSRLRADPNGRIVDRWRPTRDRDKGEHTTDCSGDQPVTVNRLDRGWLNPECRRHPECELAIGSQSANPIRDSGAPIFGEEKPGPSRASNGDRPLSDISIIWTWSPPPKRSHIVKSLRRALCRTDLLVIANRWYRAQHRVKSKNDKLRGVT